MRNANDECDKNIEHIELVQEWFHSYEFELQMWQNESLHVAIGANANIGPEIPSYTRPLQSRENYTGPLIAYIVHIRIMHK